jgi:hypothetical protein
MRAYGDGFSEVDPMTAGTGSPSYSGDLGEACPSFFQPKE